LQYISAKDSQPKLIITNDKKFIHNEIQLMTSYEFCKEYIINDTN
jgi:hypothetical protein